MSAEERFFATFGPEVDAWDVPALVRACREVWSFGYGDDEEFFTTIGEDDLWAFEPESEGGDMGVVDSWGPFRLDATTTPSDVLARYTKEA